MKQRMQRRTERTWHKGGEREGWEKTCLKWKQALLPTTPQPMNQKCHSGRCTCMRATVSQVSLLKWTVKNRWVIPVPPREIETSKKIFPISSNGNKRVICSHAKNNKFRVIFARYTLVKMRSVEPPPSFQDMAGISWAPSFWSLCFTKAVRKLFCQTSKWRKQSCIDLCVCSMDSSFVEGYSSISAQVSGYIFYTPSSI